MSNGGQHHLSSRMHAARYDDGFAHYSRAMPIRPVGSAPSTTFKPAATPGGTPFASSSPVSPSSPPDRGVGGPSRPTSSVGGASVGVGRTKAGNFSNRPQQQQQKQQQGSIPTSSMAIIHSAFGRDADLYRDVLRIEPDATPRMIRTAYFRRGREVLAERDRQLSSNRRGRSRDPTRRSSGGGNDGSSNDDEFPPDEMDADIDDDRTHASEGDTSLQSAGSLSCNPGTPIKSSDVSARSKLQFQAVSVAYEILSDDKLRKEYDTHGRIVSQVSIPVPTSPSRGGDRGGDANPIAAEGSLRQRSRSNGPQPGPGLIRNSSFDGRGDSRRASSRDDHRRRSNSAGPRRSVRWNEEVEELVIFDEEHSRTTGGGGGTDGGGGSGNGARRTPPSSNDNDQEQDTMLEERLAQLDNEAEKHFGRDMFDELEASVESLLSGSGSGSNGGSSEWDVTGRRKEKKSLDGQTRKRSSSSSSEGKKKGGGGGNKLIFDGMINDIAVEREQRKRLEEEEERQQAAAREKEQQVMGTQSGGVSYTMDASVLGKNATGDNDTVTTEDTSAGSSIDTASLNAYGPHGAPAGVAGSLGPKREDAKETTMHGHKRALPSPVPEEEAAVVVEDSSESQVCRSSAAASNTVDPVTSAAQCLSGDSGGDGDGGGGGVETTCGALQVQEGDEIPDDERSFYDETEGSESGIQVSIRSTEDASLSVAVPPPNECVNSTGSAGEFFLYLSTYIQAVADEMKESMTRLGKSFAECDLSPESFMLQETELNSMMDLLANEMEQLPFADEGGGSCEKNESDIMPAAPSDESDGVQERKSPLSFLA